MLKRRLSGVFLSFLIIVMTGCTPCGLQQGKVYVATGRLGSISQSYRDAFNHEVVDLFWSGVRDLWGDTGTEDGTLGYKPCPFVPPSRQMSAHPLDRIPQELIGRHVGKRVRIEYKLESLASDFDVPKIYVLKFEVRENTK